MSLIAWLRSSQGFWEAVEYAGELIVLFGVFLESRAESIGDDTRVMVGVIGTDGPTSVEFPLVTAADEKRRQRAAKRATRVLIAGLVIALAGIITTNRLSDEKIASLNAVASAATAQVSTATTQISTANVRIAELTREGEADKARVADAEKQTAELKKRVNDAAMSELLSKFPRIFPADEKARDRLKSLAPQTVDLIVADDGNEPRAYAINISLSCGWAGFNVRLWKVAQGSEPISRFPLQPGFGIELRKGSNQKTKDAATELNRLLFEGEMRGEGAIGPIPTVSPMPIPEFPDGELRYIEPIEFEVEPLFPNGPKWHKKDAAAIRIIIFEKMLR